MLSEDLIALGLKIGRPGSEPALPPASSTDAHRPPIERLLTLLRDFVAGVELADGGTLQTRIEECRQAVVSAGDTGTISASINACSEASQQVLARIDRQRVDQKKEIASIVAMVREALAIVSGDGHSFSRHIGHSMERFEALARIDDVQQLKAELVREVGALREIAAERQKAFQATCGTFGLKVERLERQLTITKQEAALDGLTRISNRGTFDRSCLEWLNTESRQFVLAMLDVDDFKSINDTHGHGVGDRALAAVAQALKSSVRQGSDVVARIGGDEFAVLIADLTLQQAEARLRMLGSSLAAVQFETPAGAPLKITLSCGVAEHSAGDTIESLMERADKALYEAKRLGKNCIVSKVKPTLRDLRKH
jgi:diguanylate cyclase (GGDEF)-like protein